MCVGNLSSIGSDNSLSPGRRQAIIWTNAGILLIGPLGTNFVEILIEIHTFIQENAFENVVCEMASVLSRSQYVNKSLPELYGRGFADGSTNRYGVIRTINVDITMERLVWWEIRLHKEEEISINNGVWRFCYSTRHQSRTDTDRLGNTFSHQKNR